MRYSFTELTKNVAVKDDAVILGIESSCDETAAAIVKGGRKILSDVIISSAPEHAKYGGVVPEIASRAHTEAVSDAVKRAIKEADISLNEIDAVAVTYGAGLLGALLVGLSYAKSLAFSLGVPLIPVSHIRGHIAAAYLADEQLAPPFISVLTSGGHTAISLVSDFDKMHVLGGTKDDAIGEAFDKVARVLSLPYPGGPNVEKLALSGEKTVSLPKMFKGEKNYDFSYSGLKTAVINFAHNVRQSGRELPRADIAASFQAAAVDVVVDKAIAAAKETGVSVIAVGGGVAANGYLRAEFLQKCADRSIKCVIPPKRICTDNAAMIAAEGYIQYKKRNFADLTLNAQAAVPLT